MQENKLGIRGAIFDLDGTLLDSMGMWAQVDVRFLAQRGLPVEAEYTQAVSSMSFGEAARYTIDRYGLTDTKEDIIGF